MKKRICALILSCMVAFTGMPVNAAEGEVEEVVEITAEETIEGTEETAEEEIAEEEIIDSDVDFFDSGNADEERAEDRLGSDPNFENDWESEWMERYGFTKTEEGDYQLVDEEGNVVIYNSEDPELFKYYPIEEEAQELIPLELGDGSEWELLEGATNPDPHVFKLNTSHKYSYPKYYKTSDDSKRVAIHYGIDVSTHQGNLSEATFRSLKNDYGLEYVILRVGFRGYGDAGNIKPDDRFENNIKNAYNAGLKVGIYFFSQATSLDEGISEANFSIEALKPYKSMVSLPVYIDYEYSGNPGRLRKANLGRQEHTDICNIFCKTMTDAGYRAGIYANKSMLLDDMYVSQIPSAYNIWMANYVSAGDDGIYSTTYGERLNVWQFTSSFTGFSSMITANGGKVDFDFWFGDFPAASTSLVYDANGGFGAKKTVNGKVGQKVTVIDNPYTNDGYSFDSWNTAADGKGTTYNPGDTFTLTKEKSTLYAIWTAYNYTVTFDSMGGSKVSPVKNVAYDSLIGEPAEPKRADYSFTGWYLDSETTVKWDFAVNRVKRDTTLYAGWKLTDESNDWGDLGKEENADAKASFEGDATKIPTGLWAFGVQDADYTGEAITFENLRVFYHKTQLDASEFTVKYCDNKAADKPKTRVIITAKGRFSGKIECPFRIRALSLGDEGENSESLRALDISLLYNKKVQKGTTSVSYKVKTLEGKEKYVSLKAGTDFTYVYPGTDKKASDYDAAAFVGTADEGGSYKVTIVGKGNFTGKATFTENILPNVTDETPVSKLKVSGVKNQQLSLDDNGDIIPAEPKPVVKLGKELLTEGVDYTLSYTNQTNPGNAYVYITGTGKRFVGTRRVDYKISAIPMKKVKITGFPQTSFVYDRTAHTVSGYVLTYYPDAKAAGRVLSEGKDFEVKYTNNVNAGKATVSFIGKGAYAGKLTKNFTIAKIPFQVKKAQNENISIYMDRSVEYTGSAVKPFVEVIYNYVDKDGVARTYYLKEGTDYTLKYKNNKKACMGSSGGSMPTVTITAKGNFSGSLSRNFIIHR